MFRNKPNKMLQDLYVYKIQNIDEKLKNILKK